MAEQIEDVDHTDESTEGFKHIIFAPGTPRSLRF